MKKFLIIDDHTIVRAGLTVLLKDFYPKAVIFEASEGTTALEILKKTSFDLVIMDIKMPETDTVNLLQYITIRHPQTNVLIFSMSPENLYGKRFFQAGAKGYISKEASLEEVGKAIETVLQGKKYVSQELLQEFLETDKLKNPFDQLSAREFEIAHLLITDSSVSQIASLLSIQPTTVATYKARIFEKLKVTSILQLKELADLYH